VHVLPTLNGNLACGEVGEGKLTTPEEITAYDDLILGFGGRFPAESDPLSGALRGKTVLISGGHTEEPLDGVRFLANRSSGKTAIVIARAFRLCGADVRLVLGRAVEVDPNGIPLTRVRTSAEFREAMHVGQSEADVVVMAAAIADFVPALSDTQSGDTSKWKGSRELKNLALSPTPNILEELGQAKKPRQVLVGFALETDDPLSHGLEKMETRNCDVMVVNTPLSHPGAGFGTDSVEAAVLTSADQKASLRLMSKNELAVEVVRAVRTAITGTAA
jgi:phosphopantothenoylcysteine decarboxylase/phosphopantothenate--cysteine ligase